MRRLLLALLLLPVPCLASVHMGLGFYNVSSSAPDLTANWTISMWIIFTAEPAAIPTQPYTRANSIFVSQFRYSTLNNKLGVFVGTTSITGLSVNINADIWYNVVTTRSGDTETVYLNGAQVAQNLIPLTQDAGTSFAIGGGPDGSGLAQGGAMAISEVAGWNSALSLDLITALAHGTRISEFPIRPVYYWPNYSAGAGTNGTVVPDMSGNAWHGSVELTQSPGFPPLISDLPGDCPCGMPYHH